MTTHVDEHKTVEKAQEVVPSPVGSESEKPEHENVENVATRLSDEESQQHEFKASNPGPRCPSNHKPSGAWLTS